MTTALISKAGLNCSFPLDRDGIWRGYGAVDAHLKPVRSRVGDCSDFRVVQGCIPLSGPVLT